LSFSAAERKAATNQEYISEKALLAAFVAAVGRYFASALPPPKTLTPAPLPTTPSPSPGEGSRLGPLAVLPLLPGRGWRGREKRAGVMRVLGGGWESEGPGIDSPPGG